MAVKVRGKVVPEPGSLADLKRDFGEILGPYEKELRVEALAKLRAERAERDVEDRRLHDWYVNAGRS